MSGKAVCPRCHGEGRYVNPAVDGDGFTASEWDEMGPDFQEDYMSGTYDVICERCKGANVVDACRDCSEPVIEGHWYDSTGGEVPYDHCPVHATGPELEAWQDELDYQDEIAAERRMGA